MAGFKVILVPVDFSANTDVAISKALELADPESCTVHLLHVMNERAATNFLYASADKNARENYREWDVRSKLLSLKSSVKECSPDVQLSTCLVRDGNIQQVIIHHARKMNADLVIIGQNNTHPWLPFLSTVSPATICQRSNCAVLTVKQSSMHNGIKKVVVAVDENISESTLNAIAGLSKKGMTKTYLVTFINHKNIPENFSAASILKLYQWMKLTLNRHVEYTVLRGANKMKALIKFAENYNADILLLRQDTKSKVGWPVNNISSCLSPFSPLQVLLV